MTTSEPVDVTEDLFLEPPLSTEEQLAEVQIEYAKAVALLRYVLKEARQFYRSGNPGRKDAGYRLLQILDQNGVS